MKIRISPEPFMLGYIATSFVGLLIWGHLCEKINKDGFVKPVSYIIGIISFSITLIILLSAGVNAYSFFFYIGGMQMLLYPAIVLERSNGDVIGTRTLAFTFYLQLVIPLHIYLYLNPSIKLFKIKCF